MAGERVKVLIVGESAYKIHIHFKGFASYETGYMSGGLDRFTDRLQEDARSLRLHAQSRRVAALPLHDQSDACLRRDRHLRCSGRQLSAPPQLTRRRGDAEPPCPHRRLCARRRRLCHDRRVDVLRRLPREGALCLLPAREAVAYRDRPERRPHGDAGGSSSRAAHHPEPSCSPVSIRNGPTCSATTASRQPAARQFSRSVRPAIRPLSSMPSARDAWPAFASDIQPHWGSPRFIEWDGYLPFWCQLFRWLAGR